MKNERAKTLPWDNAYSYWSSANGTWIHAVLKHYQTPANELMNFDARAFCKVFTTIVPEGEMGDVYLRDFQQGREIPKEIALHAIRRLQA